MKNYFIKIKLTELRCLDLTYKTEAEDVESAKLKAKEWVIKEIGDTAIAFVEITESKTK